MTQKTQPQQQNEPDPGDVVIEVVRQGPHGEYKSVYTVNAVVRYFTDAHSIAQKDQKLTK